mmetsp:Transcript_64196/g.123509  ORF Transcript_64196/g.123509 Transcript_64196/m.123509 type:complete len:446 (+) Transcript_64196:65-1402(+)
MKKASDSPRWHERSAMVWILFGMLALQQPMCHGLKHKMEGPADMMSKFNFSSAVPGQLGASLLENPHSNTWPAFVRESAKRLGIHLGNSLFLQRHARTTSALEQVLPMIDAKASNLTEKVWKRGECATVVKGLVNTSVQVQDAMQLVHTGLFLKSWNKPPMVKLAVRKLRLVMLSFLATQDLKRMQLHVWLDVDVTDPNGIIQQELKEILVKPSLSESVVLHRFDAGKEFSRISPNAAVVLTGIFDRDGAVQAKSDLQRVILLYSYGGMWLDTDVILIQNLTPLMGFDWAYLGQEHIINNAALSVSAPQSVFATSYLMALVSQYVTPELQDTSYFKHGPVILSQLHNHEWTRNSFHVLPTCFFDGHWSGEEDSPAWPTFFSDDIDEKQLSYIMPRNNRRTAFAYHWHGNWGIPISNRSLAYGLERIYSWMLTLNTTESVDMVDTP